ncbi:MAG: hypothetical protein WCY09_08260 [Candidatus Omnitrophota bacterium]
MSEQTSNELSSVHQEPSVHEKRTPLEDECLAGMIVAFDQGDMKEVTRLFDVAMNERFEAGIEYAKDTVSEWNVHEEE